jgi:AcrR family transcriptional regulator
VKKTDDDVSAKAPGESRSPFERLVDTEALHQGLRERKKALMRQLISDTATLMFLERGFDEVRVSEVAAACDVSEKTIYNYFPTKESLLLDREEESTDALRKALGPDGDAISPVEAIVRILKGEVDEFVTHFNSTEVMYSQIAAFNDLIESTPSLKAARADMIDRLAQVAAESMAARAGIDPNDPEPQIAADALTSLWRIFYRAIVKYSNDEYLTGEEIRNAVLSDVRRAARLLDTGLWSFATVVQGASGREQFKAASDASDEARKQVLAAMKQARTAWRAIKTEMESHAQEGGPGRRSLSDPRAAHMRTHHPSREEAFEIRQMARERSQEIKEEARQRGQELKEEARQRSQELKGEVRQRGQEFKQAVKRSRRPGPR